MCNDCLSLHETDQNNQNELNMRKNRANTKKNRNTKSQLHVNSEKNTSENIFETIHLRLMARCICFFVNGFLNGI